MKSRKFQISISSSGNIYLQTPYRLTRRELARIKVFIPTLQLDELKWIQDRVNQSFQSNNNNLFILFDMAPNAPQKLYYLNDHACLIISEDEMTGWGQLSPNATRQHLDELFEKAGVVFGIQNELIEDKLTTKDGQPFEAAIGTPSISARNPTINYYYLTHRPIPINIRQKSKACFLDLTLENRCLKNQVIATIEGGNGGQPGMTITGCTIPELSVPNDPIILGANVFQKNHQIYSSISGLVRFSESVVDVIPTLVINTPIFDQTIDFDGTIILETSVKRSKIHARYDLIVHGSVEDCQLSCDGFTYLLSGLIGGRSTVDSHYDVFCAFVYYATVTSHAGNITIGYEAYHAFLKAPGAVIVERKISGGTVESETHIRTDVAGSERMQTKTQLILKPRKSVLNPKKIKFKMDTFEEELKTLHTEKHALLNRYATKRSKLMANSRYRSIVAKEFKLSEEFQIMLNILDSEENRQNYRANLNSILIYGKIWNGVELHIDGEELIMQNEKPYASTFQKGQYGIIRKPYA